MELKFLKKLAEMEYKKMIMYPLIIFVAALLIIAVKPPTLGIDLAGGVVEGFSSLSGEKGVNIYAPVGSSPEEIIKVLEEKYPKARYAQSEVQQGMPKVRFSQLLESSPRDRG